MGIDAAPLVAVQQPIMRQTASGSELAGTGSALVTWRLARHASLKDPTRRPHGCAPAVAAEIAAELAAKSVSAVTHIKRLVREFGRGDPEAGFAAERTLFCDLMVGEPAIRRMHAMNAGKLDLRDRRAVPVSG